MKIIGIMVVTKKRQYCTKAAIVFLAGFCRVYDANLEKIVDIDVKDILEICPWAILNLG